jgi:predicted phosphodiesterase
MMRVLLMSDLHNEFEPSWRKQVAHVARQGKPQARPAAQALVDDWSRRDAVGHPKFGPSLWDVGAVDLVLLAGDVDLGVAAVEYAAEVAAFLECPVCLVPGNHEFYQRDFQQTLADMRACAAASRGRVHLLDRDRADFVVDGRKVAVLGATLWTDYALFGDVDRSMADAAGMLNDHKLVRWMSGDGSYGTRFQPRHALDLHREARAWLADELPKARAEADAVLVATHHAPLADGNPPQFKDSVLAPAFVSDMRAEVEASQADVWAFGHTHWSFDAVVGKTRVVSAQRGYVGQEAGADGFVPLLLEV